MVKYKIGDIVEFGNGINTPISDIAGTGTILGIAYDYPLSTSYIVLILNRNTKFLKDKPEKALIISDVQMRLLK